MKTTMGKLGWIFLALTTGACAQEGGGTDSESHFQCGTDADCAGNDEATVCVEYMCERPNRLEQSLSLLPDEDPGPAVDCHSEWPPDVVSFETSENRLPVSGEGSVLAPTLNRNGTVLFGVVTTTTTVRDDSSLLVQGHLVRWTGNRLAWLGQSSEGSFFPVTAVSCDGMTVVGATRDQVAQRWSGDRGFESLTADAAMTLQEVPLALSEDGATVWGLRRPRDTLEKAQSVRWTKGSPQAGFTVPYEGNLLQLPWSADGTTLVITEPNGNQYVQSLGSNQRRVVVEASSDLPVPQMPASVSSDGKFVAGVRPRSEAADETSYLWEESSIVDLPRGTRLIAVTPRGVGVGWAPDDGVTTTQDEDIVWDGQHGRRHLRLILTELGVPISEDIVKLLTTAISDDGRVIAGTCQRRNGDEMLFRAVLPAGVFD